MTETRDGTMVDVIAKAMQSTGGTGGWPDLPESRREGWRKLARAALEAMRDMPEFMLDAAMLAESDRTVGGKIRAQWSAAIDAALSEEG